MNRTEIPPRVAAIHDLSCYGRCALTVILPTLSVMGYQVIPVPTALLSTHTGGYTGLHFHDLTPDMERISAHFGQIGASFRSVYTGFLGSTGQIETVERFIRQFSRVPDESGECPLVLVDPVMGDDGELYSTYTPELANGIRRLCGHADVITPNLTEACFLTGCDYFNTAEMPEEKAIAFAERLVRILGEGNSRRIVVTGIRLRNGTVANVGTDTDRSFFTVCEPECGCSYPGTGDIFASVLLGEVLGGKPFRKACEYASAFVALLIRKSCRMQSPVRAGVALEPELWRLADPELFRSENQKGGV